MYWSSFFCKIMNENDFNNFDAITRFQVYQAQRKYKKSKQPGKIRYCIMVKIDIFSWDNMAFLCDTFLLPEKKALFFLFCRSTRPEVFCGLQRYLKRLWRRCFPVNFVKFLRTPFLTEHLRWLLLFLNK